MRKVKLVRLQVRILPNISDLLDEVLKDGIYYSKAEFVRSAIRKQLLEDKYIEYV